MNWALRAAGILVALMFILGAAAINGATAWHLGAEPWQKYVLAGIVVGAVVCEALGLLFVRHHWRAGNRALALAGVALMLAAAVYTVRMELRFFTESHSGMSGQRHASIQDRRDYEADIARARQELSWMPEHRPVAVVRLELAALKAKYGRGSDSYCAMKSRWAARTCRKLTKLESELATAEQASNLKADIRRWTAAKRTAPVVAEAMPEAAWLSRRLPVSEDGAADWLMVGGILFLLLARTIALSLAMTGAPERHRTQLDSTPGRSREAAENAAKTPLFRSGEGRTRVESTDAPGRRARTGDSKKRAANVLDFRRWHLPQATPVDSLADFLHEVRAAGGGQLSFPEILARYERFCRDRDLEPEARNYVGKRLKDLGFRSRRRRRKNGPRLTVYDIPPLMQETVARGTRNGERIMEAA